MTRRTPLRRMDSRTRVMLLTVAAVAALSGCGPEHSVTLGVRDVPTDILLKSGTPPISEPPAPGAIPPGFPFVPTPVSNSGGGVVVALPPPIDELPPPAPVSCPVASPLTTPAVSAPRRPDAPPAAKAYSVRVDGKFVLTGTNASSGRYGPTGVRKVTDPTTLSDGSGYTYSISDEQGLTTAYKVVPQQVGTDAAPVELPNQPLVTQPGIYVTSFVYERSDKTKLALTPQPPLMVAKLPFTSADRWTSHAVDAATGISITLNGQTGIGAKYSPYKARVDACGNILDGYWVEYTVDTTPVNDAAGNPEPPSQLSGQDLLIQFVGSRVAFGTQYGGLPLEEIYTLKGTDMGTTVDITRHAVYSSEPARVSRGAA